MTISPAVIDSVMVSMAVTSLLHALPPPPTEPKSKLMWAYKILYDWVTGFWSMRSGQKFPLPTSPVAPDKQ